MTGLGLFLVAAGYLCLAAIGAHPASTSPPVTTERDVAAPNPASAPGINRNKFSPFAFKHHEIATGKTAKRQPVVDGNVLERTMLADLHYTCPESGPARRTFRWQAKFTKHNAHIYLYGLHNIDRFDRIHVSLADFDSFMHHSYCKVALQLPYQICFYHVRMQTYGRVNRNSISMGLTMSSMVSDDGPWVEEACLNFVNAPRITNQSDCAASSSTRHGPFSSSACLITSLTLYTVV